MKITYEGKSEEIAVTNDNHSEKYRLVMPYTINEIRAIYGLNAIPYGDEFLVTKK